MTSFATGPAQQTALVEPTPAAGPRGARPARAIDAVFFNLLRAHLAEAALALRFWDGTELPAATPETLGTLVVRDRRTLLGLVWDPELQFGDAYAEGRVELDGDLVGALASVYRSWRETPWSGLRLVLARLARFGSNRRAIHHHYDLGNDFYRLWLDRQLVYTCAYFPAPDATLEDAQAAKLDLVCRKLALRPGEHVVEAGCGWGALALHMARHYGVTVRACNLSHEQIVHAREAAAREGLAGRVEFVEEDFEGIRGPADAFVSVGMLEHVGRGRYHDLGEVIDRCLHPVHGRGLLHFIGRTRRRPLNAWIRRRIFPGAYPPTLAEVADDLLGPAGLCVTDVENLRPHYARTLAHWRGRFEAAAGTVARMFDDRFLRAWRLYLAGSQASFETGHLQLYQVLFTRDGNDRMPWTRARLADNGAEGHGTL
jgi:cyclopropane-fatty-acyl-phospholipid synthase